MFVEQETIPLNPELDQEAKDLLEESRAKFIENKYIEQKPISLEPESFKERVARKIKEEAEKDKAGQEERNKKVKELAEHFKKGSKNKNTSSQQENAITFNEAGNIFNRKIVEAGEKYKTKASKILEERNSLIKKASEKYETAIKNKDRKQAEDAIAWRNEIINLTQKKDTFAKNRFSEEVLKAKNEFKEAKEKFKKYN